MVAIGGILLPWRKAGRGGTAETGTISIWCVLTNSGEPTRSFASNDEKHMRPLRRGGGRNCKEKVKGRNEKGCQSVFTAKIRFSEVCQHTQTSINIIPHKGHREGKSLR